MLSSKNAYLDIVLELPANYAANSIIDRLYLVVSVLGRKSCILFASQGNGKTTTSYEKVLMLVQTKKRREITNYWFDVIYIRGAFTSDINRRSGQFLQ